MKKKLFASIVLIALIVIVGCKKEEEKEVIFPFDKVEGNYLISSGTECFNESFYIHRLDETKFFFSLDTTDCDTFPDFTFKLVAPFLYESHLFRYSAKFELINNPMFHILITSWGDISFFHVNTNNSTLYLRLESNDNTHFSIEATKIN